MVRRDNRPLVEQTNSLDVKRTRVPAGSFVSLKACVVAFFLLVFSLLSSVSAADPTVVRVIPASQEVAASESFVITVECLPGQPVKAFELKLSFNPSLLQATAVSEGDLFAGYTTFFSSGVIDNSVGTIINVYNLIVGPGTVTNAGSLVTINFTARTTSGTSSLGLYDVRVTNETGYIPISVSSGSVTITGGSSPPPPGGGGSPGGDPPASENTPPQTPRTPDGPRFALAGVSYSYSSAAIDPDGDLLRLQFDWGDGNFSEWSDFVASNTSVSASHAWESVSNFTVRVIAQDAWGLNSSWSDPLTVVISQQEPQGLPPVGTFNVPHNASANQTILFDASGVYDPDGVIVSYVWEFGDGTTGEGKTLYHTYQLPGEYTVTLTVTDNSGLTYTTSQVVPVAADLGAVLQDAESLLPFYGIVLLLLAAVVLIVVLLWFYRDPLLAFFLEKRIQMDKPKAAALKRGPVDIDQIVDALFLQMKQKMKIPNTDSILDAYSDLIIRGVEKNTRVPLPSLSIKEVEDLVDRRMHTLVAQKVDRM